MQGKDRFGASRPMVPSLPRQSRVDDWPILLDFATGILAETGDRDGIWIDAYLTDWIPSRSVHRKGP